MPVAERRFELPLSMQARPMRYQIEYLSIHADELSVCHVTRNVDLTSAEIQAWQGAPGASRLHGAHGFQIRDMEEDGEVVSTGTFERTA